MMMLEHYEVWVVLGHDYARMIRKNKYFTIIKFFVLYMKRNSSRYQFYSFNFWINTMLSVSKF